MVTLLIVGFVAGVVTSISPCVLPVLPIVLTAGADAQRGWRRPVGVVAGLVVSFSVSTLIGSALLSALGLPQNLLRDLGVAVLLVIGASLLAPRLAGLLERPFARLGARRGAIGRRNGFVLGLGLGLVYVPCAGPVLATIAVVGATHHIGWRAVALTAAFGVGVGVPLLILALAGSALTARVAAVRKRAGAIRVAAGAIMIVTALLIAFDLTDGLQRSVPGYASALQNRVEGSKDVSAQLRDLAAGGSRSTPSSAKGPCTPGATSLQNCGRAPEFAGISSWLNTAQDKPLTLGGLRGKVVLIDFWTYSCINCQRSLPHVESWYRDYAKDGLVVVGVHTPEFAFEHVRSNVAEQAQALGVKYPVAIDNGYATWNAYRNLYWPSEYLIDATGNIRHVEYGETGYGTTQKLIRQLLQQASPATRLGAGTTVPSYQFDRTQTPETYLGATYAPLRTSTGVNLQLGTQATYTLPARVEDDRFALAGTWTSQPEFLLSVSKSELALSYSARTSYLVLGGNGRVEVTVDGRATSSITVSGVPKLYRLYSTPTAGRHLLTLSLTPGLTAYDFTFG